MSRGETRYTTTMLLASVASKLLEDGESVFVGTGTPMIAAMLAQRTHAPNLLLVFEAGAIGPQMRILPISVGDSRTFYRAASASSMHDAMSLAQGGYLDVGFLGAAQLDIYGNINTTVIGPHSRPAVRLPGSGGANDVGSFCRRTIVIMRQDTQRFVERVDFITTPGYLNGPGAREEAGLAVDSGPYRVVTQLGLYGFDEKTKRIRLIAAHPGVTSEVLRQNSGFDIDIPDRLEVTEGPTEQEQMIMREIDPTGMLIAK
jgi:glutaconate CoA-transferase subunit B